MYNHVHDSSRLSLIWIGALTHSLMSVHMLIAAELYWSTTDHVIVILIHLL